MTHVQRIIDQLKQKQVQTNTAAPANPQVFDLPGDHRVAEMKAKELLMLKHEYNSCLKWLRVATNKLKKEKEKGKKNNLRREIDGYKGRMTELLTRIGTYTDEERMYGFKEAQNGH